jgi:DNA-binding transcriptional MerR regulator
MTEVATNGHLSIGEVLSLVQEDFPDVTISKIRFLESQGLIAPERTASGYRKFYDADIERLRWILAQQRDHFLPLKVIKKMLDQGVDVADGSQVQPSLFSSPDAAGASDESAGAGGAEPAATAPADGDRAATGTPRSAAHPAVASAPKRARKAAPEPVAGDADPGAARKHSTPADVVAALQEDPRAARAKRPARDAPDPEPTSDPVTTTAPSRTGGLEPNATGEPMTRQELCEAVGISEELLADLESYGLIVPAALGGITSYDAEGQMIARMAVRYVELGVEPRHLRMYKVAAEREGGFVEQLVMPLLKQRNPASREQAVERTDELLSMGAELHAALLRRQLGPILGR